MCTQFVCWLKTEKTWLLCRFSHCTCASHLKSAMCVWDDVCRSNTKHTPWWCKKSNEQKETFRFRFLHMVKWKAADKTRNARTHTHNEITIHIFLKRKANLREKIKKNFWWCVMRVCMCVFVCVSLCRYKCVNLFANVSMIPKTCVHKWDSLHRGHKISRIFVPVSQ